MDVNEGQTLAITGVLRELPSIERAQQRWDLTAANTIQLKNQELYLSAERVQVKEG